MNTVCWEYSIPFHSRNTRKGCFLLLKAKAKRVAIATTALSVGVNFPDVRYVVHFGPARNLLDFHQQAGRAGRDRNPSDIIVLFYGQQLSHCEDYVCSFLKSTTCYRVASYSSFDPDIAPLLPSHDCCNFCAKNCCCDSPDSCKGQLKPFERESTAEQENPAQCRHVSDEERALLKVHSQSCSQVCPKAMEEVHLGQHRVTASQKNSSLMWWHIAINCFQSRISL